MKRTLRALRSCQPSARGPDRDRLQRQQQPRSSGAASRPRFHKGGTLHDLSSATEINFDPAKSQNLGDHHARPGRCAA